MTMIPTIVWLLLAVLIATALIFCLNRLIKGPTPFDRILGLDSFNIVIVGVIVMVAHLRKNELFLDVALIYGILSFLETIAFARFLERRVD